MIPKIRPLFIEVPITRDGVGDIDEEWGLPTHELHPLFSLFPDIGEERVSTRGALS